MKKHIPLLIVLVVGMVCVTRLESQTVSNSLRPSSAYTTPCVAGMLRSKSDGTVKVCAPGGASWTAINGTNGVAITNPGASRIPYYSSSSVLTADAGLTYDGSSLNTASIAATSIIASAYVKAPAVYDGNSTLHWTLGNTTVAAKTVEMANVATTASAGTSLSLDLRLGNFRTVTFGAGNITNLTAVGIPTGEITIILIQDGVGARTADWNNSVFKFPGAVEPTLTTTANAVDVFKFYCNGTICRTAGLDVR